MTGRLTKKRVLLVALPLAFAAAGWTTITLTSSEWRAKNYFHDDRRFPEGVDDSLDQLGIAVTEADYGYEAHHTIKASAWLALDVSGTGCEAGDASCLYTVFAGSDWAHVHATPSDQTAVGLSDDECALSLRTVEESRDTRWAGLPGDSWTMSILCGPGI